MTYIKMGIFSIFLIVIVSCGTLEKKAVLINLGDSRDQVLRIMGTPDDRQFKGKNEAWQYCKTGAGFGYHDYRIFWFYDGKVTGVNSYKAPGQKRIIISLIAEH